METLLQARVAKVYGRPVLMSSLGALVLNKSVKDIINQHYMSTLENLMRLDQGTPPSVVYFLSGSLPGILFSKLSGLTG